MKELLNLEDLYLFTQVIEKGSFARVARDLNIPKPTLSRRIQNLEGRLGVQLLVRTTRALKPSQIGLEFYQRALTVLSTAEAAELVAAQTKKEPQGLLRITTSVEYGLTVIGPLLNRFCEKYPKVNVELDLTGRTIDLIKEDFDVAIRIGPLPDSNLSSARLGHVQYGLFASPAFLKNVKIQSPEDLARHPTLASTRIDHGRTWTLINGLKEHKLQIGPKIRSNNYLIIIKAAEAGHGIAFMPFNLVRDLVKEGKLKRILPEWTSVQIPIHALYPAQKYISPKVRTFIDFLRENI